MKESGSSANTTITLHKIIFLLNDSPMVSPVAGGLREPKAAPRPPAGSQEGKEGQSPLSWLFSV